MLHRSKKTAAVPAWGSLTAAVWESS